MAASVAAKGVKAKLDQSAISHSQSHYWRALMR